jgi:hypothetical protein
VYGLAWTNPGVSVLQKERKRDAGWGREMRRRSTTRTRYTYHASPDSHTHTSSHSTLTSLTSPPKKAIAKKADRFSLSLVCIVQYFNSSSFFSKNILFRFPSAKALIAKKEEVSLIVTPSKTQKIRRTDRHGKKKRRGPRAPPHAATTRKMMYQREI